MKTLELNQMEELNAGSNAQAVACGIGVGLLFTPAVVWGIFVFATFCLVSDSN